MKPEYRKEGKGGRIQKSLKSSFNSVSLYFYNKETQGRGTNLSHYSEFVIPKFQEPKKISISNGLTMRNPFSVDMIPHHASFKSVLACSWLLPLPLL